MKYDTNIPFPKNCTTVPYKLDKNQTLVVNELNDRISNKKLDDTAACQLYPQLLERAPTDQYRINYSVSQQEIQRIEIGEKLKFLPEFKTQTTDNKVRLLLVSYDFNTIKNFLNDPVITNLRSLGPKTENILFQQLELNAKAKINVYKTEQEDVWKLVQTAGFKLLHNTIKDSVASRVTGDAVPSGQGSMELAIGLTGKERLLHPIKDSTLPIEDILSLPEKKLEKFHMLNNVVKSELLDLLMFPSKFAKAVATSMHLYTGQNLAERGLYFLINQRPEGLEVLKNLDVSKVSASVRAELYHSLLDAASMTDERKSKETTEFSARILKSSYFLSADPESQKQLLTFATLPAVESSGGRTLNLKEIVMNALTWTELSPVRKEYFKKFCGELDKFIANATLDGEDGGLSVVGIKHAVIVSKLQFDRLERLATNIAAEKNNKESDYFTASQLDSFIINDRLDSKRYLWSDRIPLTEERFPPHDFRITAKRTGVVFKDEATKINHIGTRLTVTFEDGAAMNGLLPSEQSTADGKYLPPISSLLTQISRLPANYRSALKELRLIPRTEAGSDGRITLAQAFPTNGVIQYYKSRSLENSTPLTTLRGEDIIDFPTMVHEFGHIMEKNLGLNLSQPFSKWNVKSKEFYDALSKDFATISRYGTGNFGDAFAEAISMYVCLSDSPIERERKAYNVLYPHLKEYFDKNAGK